MSNINKPNSILREREEREREAKLLLEKKNNQLTTMVQYDTCVLQNLLLFVSPLFSPLKKKKNQHHRAAGGVIVRVFFFFFIVIIICILPLEENAEYSEDGGQPRVVVIHQSFEKNTTGDDDSYDGRHSNENTNEYILLTLDYVDDMLDKRGPHREEHIAGARKAFEEGKCAMAGALTDPVDTGVFVFKNVDKAYVERFVQNDAYYKQRLVPRYSDSPVDGCRRKRRVEKTAQTPLAGRVLIVVDSGNQSEDNNNNNNKQEA